MTRNYTATYDGRIAVPADTYTGTEALPVIMGEGRVRALAREVADGIIADAENLHGPVVWITGNQYMPPMRAIPQAEAVYQAENNWDGELWAFFTELVEDYTQAAGVYLCSPDYDNALYAVDTKRWTYREEVDGEDLEDLNDYWEPADAA